MLTSTSKTLTNRGWFSRNLHHAATCPSTLLVVASSGHPSCLLRLLDPAVTLSRGCLLLNSIVFKLWQKSPRDNLSPKCIQFCWRLC